MCKIDLIEKVLLKVALYNAIILLGVNLFK